MRTNYKVTAETLNIRSGPGTQYEVWGNMEKGRVIKSPDLAGWIPILLTDGTVGWASKEYLTCIGVEKETDLSSPPIADDAPWMKVAKKYLGTKEIPGAQDNSQVVKWHQTTSLKAQDDETPWCSAFVNAVMEETGYKGTGSAAAASWLEWGQELDGPRYGCIVVLSRSGGNHVGFYVDGDEDTVKLLGGNQSNSVSEAWYRLDSLRGYRWPA